MLLKEVRASGSIVIVIAGPGCAGKSTFAIELSEAIRETGVPNSLLDLDCYLIERAKRISGPTFIGGYNPAGYLLEQAAIDIAALRRGDTISVSPYDKATSGRAPFVKIAAAPVIIIEGSMALQEPVRGVGNINLYMDAPESTLFTNRRRREIGLGLSDSEIIKKFSQLCEDYQLYIKPQSTYADICIEIDQRYRFTRVETTAKTSFGQ
jgi:uridine kinase